MSLTALFGPKIGATALARLRERHAVVRHGRAALERLVGDLFRVPSETMIRRHAGAITSSISGVVDNDVAVEEYRRGAVVRLDQAEVHDRAIARLTRGLAKDFGIHPARPWAYGYVFLTPPGRDFAAHFDHSETIILQLRGRKRWSFAPNSLPWPTGGNGLGEVENVELRRIQGRPFPHRMPRSTVTEELRPGSALALPRGHWHKTHASDESVSISFGMHAPCWADLALDRLREVLVSDPAWREPAIGGWGSRGATKDARARLARLLATPPPALDAGELIAGFGLRRAAFGHGMHRFTLDVTTELRLMKAGGTSSLRVVTQGAAYLIEVTSAHIPLCRWLAGRRRPFGQREMLLASPPLSIPDALEFLELLVQRGAIHAS